MSLVFRNGRRGAIGRQIQNHSIEDHNEIITDENLIEKLKEVKFDAKSKKIICSLLPRTSIESNSFFHELR